MTARLEWTKASPDVYATIFGLGKALAETGLEHLLIELVYLRTPQIGDCAYCVNMYTNDMHETGKIEQCLQALCVWQETPYFTPCKRAALVWTERLARLNQGPLPYGLFDELREHFNDRGAAELTPTVSVINAWNHFDAGMDT